MRDFSKISPAVWASERFNDLPSDDARYLYLFLLTSEHQNSAGLYKLKDEYAEADLRWGSEKYQKARQELIAADMIRFDGRSKMVLITRWFKHNAPMNESHFIGVVKVIEKLGNSAFQHEALEAVTEAYDAVKASKQKPLPKVPPSPPAPEQPKGQMNGGPISSAMKEVIARKGWNTGKDLAA